MRTKAASGKTFKGVDKAEETDCKSVSVQPLGQFNSNTARVGKKRGCNPKRLIFMIWNFEIDALGLEL